MSNLSQEILSQNHVCKICDFKSIKKSNLDAHIATVKHQNRTNVQKVAAQNAILPANICQTCNYTCNKKSDFIKHNATTIHKKRVLNSESVTNEIHETLDLKVKCNKCPNCDKVYSARSSLWYHKKHCLVVKEKDSNMQPKYEDFINIINKNKEMNNFLIEQNNLLLKYIIENDK